jgi:hypothetical protein
MFLQADFETELTTDYVAEAGNGEYLIRRGKYSVPGNPEEFAFVLIYKKENGKYLILRDEFEY